MTNQEPQPGQEMTVELPGGVPLSLRWCPATTSDTLKSISECEKHFRYILNTFECYKIGTREDVPSTEGFWMGTYPVTQEQWQAVMGCNPSTFIGSRNPVEMVSYKDCQEFVKKLNEQLQTADGKQQNFRLPSEAEWDYACWGGGAMGADERNLDDIGWFDFEFSLEYGPGDGSTTHPVGLKKPNGWGLYDMHGNVWEWCHDIDSDWRCYRRGGPGRPYRITDAGLYLAKRINDHFLNARLPETGFRVLLGAPLSDQEHLHPEAIDRVFVTKQVDAVIRNGSASEVVSAVRTCVSDILAFHNIRKDFEGAVCAYLITLPDSPYAHECEILCSETAGDAGGTGGAAVTLGRLADYLAAHATDQKKYIFLFRYLHCLINQRPERYYRSYDRYESKGLGALTNAVLLRNSERPVAVRAKILWMLCQFEEYVRSL